MSKVPRVVLLAANSITASVADIDKWLTDTAASSGVYEVALASALDDIDRAVARIIRITERKGG